MFGGPPNEPEGQESHPLLASYLPSEALEPRAPISDSSSDHSHLRWTTCDECKRCSFAVLSFIFWAVLVGALLVLFWFLWAWFVLWLDLPGVATPIVWLSGFAAPLCLFRLVTLFPRCTRGLCNKPLSPPEMNSWKTHHLWNERRKHLNAILKAIPEMPYQIGEIISEYCFHSDMLVTAKKNKLLGIYPDSADIHTLAEFSHPLTG